MKYTINIITLIVAFIALGFSLIRVYPCEMTNDTYIGLIATLIGISVALIIGYQIVNTLDIKNEIKEQTKRAIDLEKSHLENVKKLEVIQNDLVSKIEIQENVVQENLCIISALIDLNKGSNSSGAIVFCKLHNSFVYSLNIDTPNDYEWIFQLMKDAVADINSYCFYMGGISICDNDKFVVHNDGESIEFKELEGLLRYKEDIAVNETKIRAHKNFIRIKHEYNKIMKLHHARMKELCDNPTKDLSFEEKIAIKNS